MAVSANGTAGGTGFSLTLSGKDGLARLDESPLKVDFTARNDDAGPIYALLGLPALPLGVAGPAETEFSLDGTLAKGAKAAFAFRGDGLSARYDGQATWTESGLSADGQASLKADDLEPWLMAAGEALPGMGLGLPVKLKAGASVGDGVLILSGLTGSIADVGVAGDVNAELRDGIPHVTGSVRADSFDLALPAEALLGADALQDNGDGWPDAPFQSDPVLAATVDIEMRAGRVSAGPLGEASAARMNLRVDADGMRISDFQAKTADGRVTGLAELKNTGGTGLLNGQLQIKDARLEALFPSAGISGRGDLSVSLSGSGKNVESLVGSASGSGTATARNIEISGLDPTVFDALLMKADSIGRDIDAKATAAFAPKMVLGGELPADEADLAVTIAGGIVRAPPVRIESNGAVLTADLRADLAAGTVSAEGTLEYDAGEEALVGSEPAVRFTATDLLGDTRVQLDTAPLAQFLTQRALEKEQARVESMQAGLLESQRLRRELRYYAALEDRRAESRQEKSALRGRTAAAARRRSATPKRRAGRAG